MSLVGDALNGDRRALARVISLVEDGGASAEAALAGLLPHTGRAHIVGVTGAPGTGKSTLVNQLAKAIRAEGRRVGVVAVDPTSPFTGGAILGDRIRMRDLTGDPGVFIRSMATRGSLGGLARATADVVKVLDAAGFDLILIETVGAGQAEVDIAGAAHTVLVVAAPGMGDEVQAIKAGILEIADILVVNKADLPHADSAVRALRAMLDLAGPGRDYHTLLHHGLPVEVVADERPEQEGWQTPIFETVAVSGEGVAGVVEAIERHRAYLEESGELARRERARVAAEIEALLREVLMRRLLECVDADKVAALLERVLARQIDPHTAARSLIEGVLAP
jgi:LAO/AO transport system kinase